MFSHYSSVRDTIISDALYAASEGVLSKRQRLSDGKSIGGLTAFILSLIQSCQVEHSFWTFRDTLVLELESSNLTEMNSQVLVAISYFEKTIQSSMATFQSFLAFLVSRILGNKAIKGPSNTMEQEYRKIFETFANDVLVVLEFPEWPIAMQVSLQIHKFMMKACETPNSCDQSLKCMYIDWMGNFATQLRKIEHKCVVMQHETPISLSDENNLNLVCNSHGIFRTMVEHLPLGDVEKTVYSF